MAADVCRLARENGLLFPPDPGAAEQSQNGGDVATNAGGPHAFKYGLPACSWGHGGDGNLHSTFMVDPHDAAAIGRAHAAAAELYAAAIAMGGSISGEHGLGWVKRGHLDLQWTAPTLDLHRAIKRTLDPNGLMNPGKKT